MPAAAPISRRASAGCRKTSRGGVSPAAIDAVVITHPHLDHIPVVITSDHKMLFPNATLYVNENDHAFWTSADIRGKAPEEFRGFFNLAVNAIKPYAAAGKLSLYKDGAEFAPGVRAVACYGHTVGHSMVRVSPPGGDFLIFGDIVHCAGAAISRSGTLGGVRHRSAGGARQPQAGARHGDDRSPVVLRRPLAVRGRSATPPNLAAAMCARSNALERGVNGNRSASLSHAVAKAPPAI